MHLDQERHHANGGEPAAARTSVPGIRIETHLDSGHGRLSLESVEEAARHGGALIEVDISAQQMGNSITLRMARRQVGIDTDGKTCVEVLRREFGRWPQSDAWSSSLSPPNHAGLGMVKAGCPASSRVAREGSSKESCSNRRLRRA